MPAKIAVPKTIAIKKNASKGAGPKAVADTKIAGADKAVQTHDAGDGADAKVSVALRVKDLVERVTNAGDFKKKDVRDIVEVTLAELGRALESGEVLNLPPFGKLRVGRSRDLANGSMMTLKLRRMPAKPGGKKARIEGLADAGEAG